MDVIGQNPGSCDLVSAVQVLSGRTGPRDGSHRAHDVACLPQVFFCRFRSLAPLYSSYKSLITPEPVT